MTQTARAKQQQRRAAYRLQLDRETIRVSFLQAKGRRITARIAVIESERTRVA